MRWRRRLQPLPPPVAYYQHFVSGVPPVYRTAALYWVDGVWWVVAVDGEFRGAHEITEHACLEAARQAVVGWVGEAREVSSGDVPPSIHRKFDHWQRHGELDSDPL